MWRVEIKTEGKNPQTFINDVQDSFNRDMQGILIDMAYKTLAVMREIIVENKKRPSLGGNLEETLQVEVINTTNGVEIGIGNIADLKAKAPYFEVLDAGGYVPYSTKSGLAPYGSFYGDKPIKGMSGQNWEISGNRGFLMSPAKAIEGIDYINLGAKYLNTNLEIVTKTWINQELSKLGK